MSAFPRTLARLVVVSLCLSAPPVLIAAQLQEATSRAFDKYLSQARQRFLERTAHGTAPTLVPGAADTLARGDVIAVPGQQDGIVGVVGGLLHHWAGAVFISGVRLERVIEVSQAYDDYHRIYKPVLTSAILTHDTDAYRVQMRVKEGSGVVTAVLDIRSRVTYAFPRPGQGYALSYAEDIREVTDAGTATERRLPAGRDSGYLWRAGTFTTYVERDAGVYVELETLGLSRGFPPLLGWIIEPIARRLGRKSVEASLQEFRDAVIATNANDSRSR